MSRKSKANKSKAKKTEQARNTKQAKETEPVKKTEPVRLITFPSDFDIYQRDGEEFQELVNSVFNRNRRWESNPAFGSARSKDLIIFRRPISPHRHPTC